MFVAPSSPISLCCEWLISVKSVFSLHCCQNHNLTCKYNSVNVLLVANACPMLFAPSSPISLSCEWLISVKSAFLLHCCQNHNLTIKSNASPISLLFAGSSLTCHIVQLLGLQIEAQYYLFIYFGTTPSFIKN